MVARNSLFILLSSILLIVACLPGKDAKLMLKKNKYDGNELKVNGYYYHKSKNKFSENFHFEVFFFYKNGIIRNQSVGANSLLEVDIEIKKGGIKGFAPKAKHAWGVFNIEGEKITYEMWQSSSGGPLRTMVEYGHILNDTTYVIDRLLNNYRRKFYTKNDTFHFRQFSPKPYSITSFIP